MLQVTLLVNVQGCCAEQSLDFCVSLGTWRDTGAARENLAGTLVRTMAALDSCSLQRGIGDFVVRAMLLGPLRGICRLVVYVLKTLVYQAKPFSIHCAAEPLPDSFARAGTVLSVAVCSVPSGWSEKDVPRSSQHAVRYFGTHV